MTPSSIPSVIAQQTLWARSKGFEPRNAYLPLLAQNLRQKMSVGAQKDFERGNGTELRDRGIRPPRMHALRSSAALSVNVFDYWRSHDPAPLQEALGLHDKITRISFEENFPTGLKGNPPNIDVLLKLEGSHYVAIESKFTAWLSPRERTVDEKYFPPGEGLWTLQKLPVCQSLATGSVDVAPFKYLDAPQLLKHALGLARKTSNFELHYIYFDWKCPEGAVHADEVARFGELVGKEIRFRTMTYQELFRRLDHTARPDDRAYLEYLHARYA